MADCLIALGANLGDRAAALEAALAAIAADPQTRRVAHSRFHETAAVGGPPGQQPFLNAATRIETARSCESLWALLGDLERRLGRVRDIRWGPRLIDLDVLLYDDLVVPSAGLEIPHPRMAFRRFVLAPAAEVAADMRHPTIGWTIAELLAHLDARPNYVALAGPIGVGKSRLAARLADVAAWRTIGEPVPERELTAYYADPSHRAWRTERDFLHHRRRLLLAGDWPCPHDWAVSDFWFGQSLAFARRWLDDERFAAFRAEWEAAALDVAPPKFVVWLDAPTEVLLGRIADRGRPYEKGLSGEDIRELRALYEERLAGSYRGPLLRLDATVDLDLAAEVRAAATAMT